MISLITRNLFKMAAPVVRTAPRLFMPAPLAQFFSGVHKERSVKPFVIGSGAVIATMAISIGIEKKSLDQLQALSWGVLGDENKLSRYIKYALELENKGMVLTDFWKNIGQVFIKACETGNISTLLVLSEHKINESKLPSVNLSHIKEDKLCHVVNRLLLEKLKKITIEDFEWALLHNNYELYEQLLTYLDTDKKMDQPFWGEGIIIKGFESTDRLYCSYEYILEHPRLKPYQEKGRSFHDQYNAKLLKQCQECMEAIQGQLNTALRTTQSIDELVNLSDDIFREREYEEQWRYRILNIEAHDKLIFLKKCAETKDFSSLHSLSRSKLL